VTGARGAARAAGTTAEAVPADSTARKPRRDGFVEIGEGRFMTAPDQAANRLSEADRKILHSSLPFTWAVTTIREERLPRILVLGLRFLDELRQAYMCKKGGDPGERRGLHGQHFPMGIFPPVRGGVDNVFRGVRFGILVRAKIHQI
jgi:hypothetical protein